MSLRVHSILFCFSIFSSSAFSFNLYFFFITIIRSSPDLGSMSPPLCSICQHKALVFGKPPRRFSYEELEEATDGFLDMNFLAEVGFGLVYRGVLKNGQVFAVKQLKFTGSLRC